MSHGKLLSVIPTKLTKSLWTFSYSQRIHFKNQNQINSLNLIKNLKNGTTRNYSTTSTRISESSIQSQSKSTQISSTSTSIISSSTTTISSSVEEHEGGKWDLYVGIVLERKPLLTKDLTPIEKEYSKLLADYEVEISKKSNHEVRMEKDKIIQEKIKSGELEVDQASSQTAQDQEDLWAAELKQFTPASRKTEADAKNDKKSLKRALDSHLLLVIEQKLGKDFKWICPHGKWQQGETMRQTVEKTLKVICPDVKAKVLGNAPWGFYKYNYPKNAVAGQQLESKGAKVFFFKAQILSGEVSIGKSKSKEEVMKDYLWLTRGELGEKLHPEYHLKLAELLVDESI